MNLRPEVSRLLAWAQINPLDSYAALARRAGIKTNSVGYQLRRLQEAGKISIKPFIDLISLGYLDLLVLASISSGSIRQYQRLISLLKNDQRVSWIGNFAGDYQLGFIFMGRSLHELSALLDLISIQCPGILVNKGIAPRVVFGMYPKRYLHPATISTPPMLFDGSTAGQVVDQLDGKILKTLAEADWGSFRDVAKTIGEPVTTVERRIHKLRERQVIKGFFLNIDLKFLGMLSYRVLITTKGSGPHIRKQIHAFCKREAFVKFFVEALGSWDYELGLEVPDPQTAMRLVQELQGEAGDAIVAVKTLSEIDEFKWSFYPFMA